MLKTSKTKEFYRDFTPEKKVCGANTTPEDTGKTSFPVHRSARIPTHL